MSQQISDSQSDREAIITLIVGVKLASAVLLIVYFGLSRLLHEYVVTMVLGVLLSLTVLAAVCEKARRLRLYARKNFEDF
ncbi:MAG: hypothetical protein JSS83_22605 [Cyanobacteria bacterium SZAS LIN-3]|nr:hypothetical protein [Cyanobacteria bacterium SZAS LIN-3]